MSWNGTEPEPGDKAIIDILELVDWTGVVKSGNQSTLYFTSSLIATSDEIRVINYLAKVKIFVKSSYTYLEYDYKFLENDGTEDVTSTLDGRIQRYSGNITGSFTAIPFSVNNNNTGTLEVKSDGTTQSPVEGSGVWTDIAQLFTIRHKFIVDNYTDADVTNYIDDKPTDLFIADNCIDYFTKINLFKEKGIEQGKQTFQVRHEGNTGFLNENFNSAQTPYTPKNVVIKRLSDGSVIDAVTTQFPVLVECDLKGDFSGTNTFTIYHKSLLGNADYEFSNELYADLFNYESVRIASLGVPVSDTIIQNATITAFDANTVSVSYELHIPSAEAGYVTGVNVEKDSFSSVASDMTNVRVSSNEYQNTFDVDGLVSVDSYNIVPAHCNPLTETGGTMIATVGDDIFFIKLEFSLDLTLGAFLEEFEIRSVIYNSSNEDIKILDAKNISLVNLVDVAGIQKINDNFSSGYNSLNPNVNNAQFRYISNDGNTANYELIMPYRVPSQKHIASVDDLKDVGFYNANIDENNGSNVDFYDKEANGYTQHVGIYFKVSGSEYTYLSPDLDIKNYQEEFDAELFNSEEIDIEVDGFDVGVIINNKDNEIITTVVSVNDLTGTDLINTLYLQPITGDKYSPFEINTPLFSTDGFTHIYKGQLDKNTISSNHCLTSIVSTDDCDGNVFDDLLGDALFIYSVDQEILGEAKYRDINGVDDVDVDINLLYNQVSSVPNSDLHTTFPNSPDPNISITNKVSGLFEIDDDALGKRLLCAGSTGFSGVATTNISYTIDLELINLTSGSGSLAVVGDASNTFDQLMVDGLGNLSLSTIVAATPTVIASNFTNILNNKKTIGITKSGTNITLYVDGVSIGVFTSGYSATQIGAIEVADQTTIVRFNTSKFYIWDKGLTGAEQLAVHNEKYL